MLKQRNLLMSEIRNSDSERLGDQESLSVVWKYYDLEARETALGPPSGSPFILGLPSEDFFEQRMREGK